MAIVDRARPEILKLKAYSSARSLYQGRDDVVFLDANECPFEPYIGAEGFNRYPDQQPKAMMDALCRLYDVSSRNIVAARGADEAIDLLIRGFCVPGRDNVIITSPTFPMYKQSALLQSVDIYDVPLDNDFQLDVNGVCKKADKSTKIIFLCSPNNPTGNLINRDDIISLLEAFADKALIVVDETYIEYANTASVTALMDRYENLVVLRTLSKAYACAGVRCGVALGHSSVIDLLRKILPPYAISQPVAAAVVKTLSDKNLSLLAGKRAELLKTKDRIVQLFDALDDVVKIYPSDANFILMHVKDAEVFETKCREGGFVVRNQSHQPGLENVIRLSIGSDYEMDRLMAWLQGQGNPIQADERKAQVNRSTKETAISVKVNLDQTQPVKINTGIGFYDHMLEQIAKHAAFSLELACDGDLEIDPHHTVEDCAIALGQALNEALGDKRGIGRFGFLMPMDETLAEVAIDLSGRFYLDFEGEFPENYAGELPTDMVEHVFRSLCENLQATCHIKVKGENTHHMVEACFKGFARALRMAIHKGNGGNADDMPSTKGVL